MRLTHVTPRLSAHPHPHGSGHKGARSLDLAVPFPCPARPQPPAEPEVRRGQASGEVGLLGPSAAGVSA